MTRRTPLGTWSHAELHARAACCPAPRMVGLQCQACDTWHEHGAERLTVAAAPHLTPTPAPSEATPMPETPAPEPEISTCAWLYCNRPARSATKAFCTRCIQRVRRLESDPEADIPTGLWRSGVTVTAGQADLLADAYEDRMQRLGRPTVAPRRGDRDEVEAGYRARGRQLAAVCGALVDAESVEVGDADSYPAAIRELTAQRDAVREDGRLEVVDMIQAELGTDQSLDLIGVCAAVRMMRGELEQAQADAAEARLELCRRPTKGVPPRLLGRLDACIDIAGLIGAGVKDRPEVRSQVGVLDSLLHELLSELGGAR